RHPAGCPGRAAKAAQAGGGDLTVELTKKTRPRMTLPAETGVAVVLMFAVAWLSHTFPNFSRTDNWNAILSAGAEVAIVAAGMTLVIATGGIDISVGSVIGLSGIVLGVLYRDFHWNVWLACAAALVVGASCGLVNGVLIARFKVPPIIATLA